MRAFRVLRVLRLVRRARQLRIMIDTLMISLTSMINVGGLLALLIYIYAVLGLNMFAKIKL